VRALLLDPSVVLPLVEPSEFPTIQDSFDHQYHLAKFPQWLVTAALNN